MIQDKECIIREFLMKDNENYNLTSLGFIQDFEKEISFLLELHSARGNTNFWTPTTRNDNSPLSCNPT